MNAQIKVTSVFVFIAFISLICAGCASLPSASKTTLTLDKRSTQGTLYKITQIPIPGPTLPASVQAGGGAIWSVSGRFSKNKTIKLDMVSHQVDTLDRPFDSFDLYISEQSLWLSEATSPMFGSGDLHRYDINTNQLITIVAGAGSPLAIADGMLLTYNQRTRIISVIDQQTNQAQRQVSTQGQGVPRYFTLGDGAIWQFASQEELSVWQQAKENAWPSVVRRIDPHNGQVIAEITVGAFRRTAGIYFIAGDIWVLGDRQVRGGGIALRIDVKTNKITATIPLQSPQYAPIAAHAFPQTPVFWDGGVWISTFYSNKSRMPGLLIKIDPHTNEVVDQIGLSDFDFPGISQPLLTVAAGALWAVARDAVLKVETVQ